MLSRSVSVVSQLVCNSVLFTSQIRRVPKWLRLNCEGSATSSRRVRDTRDDFATILRGILSHKIFEHVQNFRDYFAPLGDNESLATVSRLLCDPLAMFVASCRKTVAVQWDRGLTSCIAPFNMISLLYIALFMVLNKVCITLQASKYLTKGTCPASQIVLAYMGKI